MCREDIDKRSKEHKRTRTIERENKDVKGRDTLWPDVTKEGLNSAINLNENLPNGMKIAKVDLQWLN